MRHIAVERIRNGDGMIEEENSGEKMFLILLIKVLHAFYKPLVGWMN